MNSLLKPVVMVAVVAAAVFLTNLGGQDLSLDEPETWLLAKTVQTQGYPSAWDGKHLISIMNGADSTRFGEQWVWSWHPWLQHYAAALSIWLFGDTVAGLRTLFALAGAVSVGVFYAIARDLFKRPTIRWLVTGQLLLLLPFFLYMRQARYYSLLTLFSLVVLWGLLKRRPWVVMGAGIALAMTNILAWATTAVMVAGYGVVTKDRKLWAGLVPQVVVVGAWFLILNPYDGKVLQFAAGWRSLLTNLSYLNRYIVPFWLVGWVVWQRSAAARLLMAWVGVKVVADSILLVPHGRYLVDLFPIFILMLGYVYESLCQRKIGWVAAGLGLLLVIKQGPGHFYQEWTGRYPGVMPSLGAQLKSITSGGKLFWSNNYRLYLHLYSQVPDISPICDGKRLGGPAAITDPEKLQTIVLFQHDTRLAQSVQADPCLATVEPGEFKRAPITIPENTYLPNDPDIVNRQYPPIKAHPEAVEVLTRP